MTDGSATNWLFRLFNFFVPPGWRLPVVLAAGGFFGVGLTVFHVSGGTSYLSADSEACINCHLMSPQFAQWSHASHRDRATCVECHLPQQNPAATWMEKANSGMRHMFVYATRSEPFVIRTRQAGSDSIQENCIRCHRVRLDMLRLVEADGESVRQGKGRYCWQCHQSVGHGKLNS
ncbi:MAG: cytochrome c nitrite reductase small subunit, partial [Deltaproteobacteria bacterium]|nr:cytochrome c nitrite reductase small subunit [Deltaproteobacteria bacterium]